MKLSDIRKIVRAIVPGATISKIDDPLLDIVINSIVVDIAAYTKCLKTSGNFNVTADLDVYNLSTVLPSFLVPDKSGLWWNNGDMWKKVKPRTLQWLDENKPNWRDLESDDPADYDISGDVLTIVPAPAVTLASGFKLYYAKKPVDMASGDSYPFSGSSTEYSHLSIFDWAICYGAKWKLLPMLSQNYIDDYGRDKNLYLNEREEKYKEFKRRPDISADSDTRLQGPSSR
jgi:hypothetical protein